VMNYIGDGGSNAGEFHEGLNMAAVMQLPFVLIIENNQFAYSTPVRLQYAAQNLSDRAPGYGIPGVTIDGTNVGLVFETCRKAVDRARRGEGPTLIESVTMRMQGHSASDDASYVPPGMIDEWRKKDPIDRLENVLLADHILTGESKKKVESDIAAGIDDAVAFAMQSGLPAGEDAGEGVYAP